MIALLAAIAAVRLPIGRANAPPAMVAAPPSSKAETVAAFVRAQAGSEYFFPLAAYSRAPRAVSRRTMW